eukprot:scaffold5545_cov111-Isochrysis_galbana.AAC.10
MPCQPHSGSHQPHPSRQRCGRASNPASQPCCERNASSRAALSAAISSAPILLLGSGGPTGGAAGEPNVDATWDSVP